MLTFVIREENTEKNTYKYQFNDNFIQIKCCNVLASCFELKRDKNIIVDNMTIQLLKTTNQQSNPHQEST